MIISIHLSMMMMILSMLSVFVVVNNQMMMHPPMASPLPLPSVAPSSNFKATCGFARQFRSSAISTMRTSTRLSAGDFIIKEEEEEEENDVLLLTFLKDRELNGDFIAKVSDKLWMMRTNTINIHNTQLTNNNNNANQLHDEPFVDENTGGFLKLTTTNDWLLGQNTAPINKKMRAKQQRDDSQRRTRLNLLQYEAVKRELLYLTVGIGSACSVYCLITFSIQAAVSYATGVLFSCLYLQLLYRYVDNISRGEVPQIFRQKKIKKIGIRSGDLEETFERVVKGCSMALSSPRLVIPAAIYGLWGLSQHFANDYFQLTPAMVGVFAYKAAALVQVYRDNEDLQLILPGNEEDQDLQ